MSRGSVGVVLVVEDDLDFQESIKEILTDMGWRVETANSGSEARQKLQTMKVDVVLSDIQMPMGDGVELLMYLREQHPEIPPIVMMTGFSVHDLENLIARGARAVLEKPFSLDSLQKALANAME